MSEKFFKKILEAKWYVLIAFGFVSLFGFYSLNKIKIDAIPDITNKQVIVNTKTFAMDPTKVEKAVTYPIETALYGIPGLVEMRSVSKFGLSQVILIFDEKIDIYFARSQVIERISTIGSQIPQSMTPEIGPLTTGIGEILMYRVYNSKPDQDSRENLIELRTVQQFKIARELKKIRGVAEVDTIGGYERELHLNIVPEKLARFGMTPERLVKQISTIGENFGGGYIEEDEKQKLVRTYANVENFDDVMNIPIKVDYTGAQLPLSHIIEVGNDYSQRLGAATYKGKEVVVGTVMMRSDGNAKEVLLKVKDEIKRLNKILGDTQIEILYDRQFLIDSTIKTVIKNLAEGILLVIGVLCLMLGNLKIGMVVASSLLFCILMLAACMNLFGISANLMSLGAIDFGLLVDSSVVLVEFIVSNLLLQRSKIDKINSIARLSSQVSRPIILGIGIIMLVYVPILMFSGIEGKTFKPMAINVIIAMFASMIVALFLMPILCYFFVEGEKTHQENRLFGAIKTHYQKLLHYSLQYRKKVMICCGAFFFASLSLTAIIPSDFLPSLNEGDIVYTISTKEGSSLSKTAETLLAIESKLSSEKEIDKIYSKIGVSDAGLDLAPQNSADSFVIIKPNYKKNAPALSEKFSKKIQEVCPECSVNKSKPIEMRFNEMLEGSRADLSLRIFGENLDELLKITEKIKEILSEDKGLKSAEKDFINSIRRGTFIDVIPDYSQITKHQIAISNLNNDLKNAMAGIKVGNFYATEFPISIVMHLSENSRNKTSIIGKIPISLNDGGSFPLSEIAQVAENEDVVSIPRLYGKRYSGMSIYLNNTDFEKFIKKSEAKIKEAKILPDGYYLEWGGRFKNFNKAKKQILLLIPLIIGVIAFILFKMFGSVKKVLIIFSSVPFALSGAILLLFICQIPITISVYVGFIALIGISLLNSIILIDTYKSNNNLELTCMSRLKPILMTATVASLGFLPMAFGIGIGAEVQQPIAITIIGGIVSSTFTTLILSPVLLKEFISK
jgi:cobalt-zinc-cadmium resistance protein CzcA